MFIEISYQLIAGKDRRATGYDRFSILHHNGKIGGRPFSAQLVDHIQHLCLDSLPIILSTLGQLCDIARLDIFSVLLLRAEDVFGGGIGHEDVHSGMGFRIADKKIHYVAKPFFGTAASQNQNQAMAIKRFLPVGERDGTQGVHGGIPFAVHEGHGIFLLIAHLCDLHGCPVDAILVVYANPLNQ